MESEFLTMETLYSLGISYPTSAQAFCLHLLLVTSALAVRWGDSSRLTLSPLTPHSLSHLYHKLISSCLLDLFSWQSQTHLKVCPQGNLWPYCSRLCPYTIYFHKPGIGELSLHLLLPLPLIQPPYSISKCLLNIMSWALLVLLRVQQWIRVQSPCSHGAYIPVAGNQTWTEWGGVWSKC